MSAGGGKWREEGRCRHLDQLFPVQFLRLPPPDRDGLAVPPEADPQVGLVKDADRVKLVRINLLHQVLRVV